MDKKVYNKPSLKLEIFTPNEYIATCWYIAEGDCWNVLFYKDADGDGRYKNEGTEDLRIHDSHGRLPVQGFYKTEEGKEASKVENISWWYGGTVPSGKNWEFDKHGFTEITSYYSFQEENGKMHYLKNISEAPNKNATS